jgi:hypothetical protein
MLQSNSIRITRLFARRLPRALVASGLVASLLLGSAYVVAEKSLLDGDMGISSSAPSNSFSDNGSRAPEATPKFSPAQAATLVRAKVGGQVMSVNTQRSASRIIYGVKVLDDGRMRVIHVDAQTGELLNH